MPGETVTFQIEVKNTGEQNDSYVIGVADISTNTGGDTSIWFSEIEFTPSTIYDLPAGSTAIVKMEVDIPYPADLSLIPPGLYNITVQATSLGDLSKSDSEIFTVNVEQLYWADVQNTVTSKSVNIGESVEYTITIKNLGNYLDNLNVELRGDPDIPGSVNWGRLTHSATGQFDQQVLFNIELAAGASTDIILKITIPDRDDPSYPTFDPSNVTLTVVVKPSDENGAQDQVMVTTGINPIYEYNFYFFVKKLEVEPGEQAHFTIKIENTGTDADTFTYEVYQWEEDWSSYGYLFSPSSITISAGAIESVTLTINTPTDLSIAESKDYNITIKVHSSLGNIDSFDICTVFIEPVYLVELTPTGSMSKTGEVGTMVSFRFTVKNIGNIHETFIFDVSDMDISVDGGGDQSSWAGLYPVSDPTISILSVQLGIGESKAIILEISIPDKDDPDFDPYATPLRIIVEVSSVQYPIAKDSMITETSITPIYAFILTTTASMNTKEGEPGEILSYTLQLQNKGTIEDSYDFTVTSIDDTLFSILNPNSIEDLSIDKYGLSIAHVSITSDKALAKVGTYQIEIVANSKGDTSVSQKITLIVKITASPEVKITPSVQENSGDPGDLINYYLYIVNKGNAPDTFDLSLSGDYTDWGRILDGNGNPISKVSLSATGTPGYSAEIILRVSISTEDVVLGDQKYTITLTAASISNDGVFASVQVSTAVEVYAELILEYIGSGEPNKKYDPNLESPKFKFNVTNNGNQDENGIEINVENIDPDWDYFPKYIPETLEPKKTITFLLEFVIPSDESLGDYNEMVVTISAVDPSVKSEEIIITITIVKPDLSILESEIIGLDDIDFLRGKVGEMVDITTRIHNEGDAEARNVQVGFFVDDTEVKSESISKIPAGEFEDVNFKWTVVSVDVEITIAITPMEELFVENNYIAPIFLDLRPDFSFEGNQIEFSDIRPQAGEIITISAPILNSGGNAEDVTVIFYEGNKVIGTDTIDIDHGEIGVAQVDWKVPDNPGESKLIRAELDEIESTESEATRIMDIADGDSRDKDDSLLFLAVLAAIIVCLLSIVVGYQIGRTTFREKPEVVEEEPWTFEDEIDSWESTVVAGFEVVDVLPPPPPPYPPPPPPEESIQEEAVMEVELEEEEVADSVVDDKPEEKTESDEGEKPKDEEEFEEHWDLEENE
jgi:uncharacterized membrane protein